MTEQIWQRYLSDALLKQSWQGTTFAGFNTNVDVIVNLTNKAVRNLVASNPDLDRAEMERKSASSVGVVRSREDFVALLVDGLRGGKSLFVQCENGEVMSWLQEQFEETTDKLGGQAGIISNQMAALGARSVLYSPILSPRLGAVMDPRVLYPAVTDGCLELQPVQGCVREGDPTHSPWVFEYGKGERFDFGFTEVVTPRANRIILVKRIPGLGYNFAPELNPYLGSLGEKCDVGFVAGYHLGGPAPEDHAARTAYFQGSLAALRELREGNAALKIHLEYVPAKEPELEMEMLTTLTQGVDSFGINETEIAKVLSSFGLEDLAEEVRERERAYALYRGALALRERFGLERVHVHNLGYYVLVLAKPYPYPVERVRQACLFGSGVNACKAMHGGMVKREELPEAAKLPLSSIGLEQLKAFAEELKERECPPLDVEEFVRTGIAELDSHYILLVPAHIVPNPVITVGMGDTISSSSYAAEVIGVTQGG